MGQQGASPFLLGNGPLDLLDRIQHGSRIGGLGHHRRIVIDAILN
jgi:hypothetical protein